MYLVGCPLSNHGRTHASSTTPELAIMTFFFGVPDAEPAASMVFTRSMPSTTSPNTTCLPSSHAVGTVVTKNWLPLVLRPALAMDSRPGFVCLIWKFSSRQTSVHEMHQGGAGRTVEAVAVDGLAAGPVVAREVAALEHELRQSVSTNCSQYTEEARRTAGMIRWKPLFAYPNPCWPVQSSRKLRVVFGTTSSYSLKTMRPAGLLSIATSNCKQVQGQSGNIASECARRTKTFDLADRSVSFELV